MAHQIPDDIPDDIAAVIEAYKSRQFDTDQWQIAGPQIKRTVALVSPGTASVARRDLTILSAYLAGPVGWDGVSVPDFTVLLGEEHIVRAAGDLDFGNEATREMRARVLRALGRAIGTIQATQRVRCAVDLTLTGPVRTFERHPIAAHREALEVVEAALAAYTPRTMPTAAWKLVSADARRLVASTAPTSVDAAQALLSHLVALLNDTEVWDGTARPDLATFLRTQVVVAHVTRARFTSAATKATRRDSLRKLGRTVGVVHPHVARQPVCISADPFLAAGVVRPIPVVTLAAARAVTQTDRPVNLSVIGDEITRVRDLHPSSTQAWTEQALIDLAQIPAPSATSPARTEKPVAPIPPGASKRPSRRAALAAATREYQRALEAKARNIDAGEGVLPQPGDVAPEIRDAVERFLPHTDRREVWETNLELAQRLVYAYQPSSPRNACNIASYLTPYLAWAASHAGRDPDRPLDLADLLEESHVEAFIDASDWKDASRASARSVLRRVARNLRPHAAPLRLAKPKPGAPYTPAECAEFLRLALHQPTAVRQRRLAFIVGLGLGAGLDAVDYRHLTAAHFETVNVQGHELLLVHVPGQGVRARTVPVREHYVPLVRRALDAHRDANLEASDLLVAHCPASINVATPTLGRIVSADGSRHRITTARLRHTWLVAAMSAPVPMADLMQAAGIRTARNITELLEHCPTPDPQQVRETYETLNKLSTGGQS